MSFKPRTYQVEAIAAATEFFDSPRKVNAIEILPTGSGKSVVIANIANCPKGKTLVLQPSKEILVQNFGKFLSYGYRAGIYSASAGKKFVEHTTFATIGSIIKKKHLFREVKRIIIDECHLVNANDGMYREFITSLPDAKVLGLTATPYRLTNTSEGAMLEFITRTRPRIFEDVIYSIQNNVLFDAGHLAKLEYYALDLIDRGRLQMNKSGTDFTDSSLKAYYKLINMTSKTVETANRLLAKRKNLLVFASLLSEAYEVAKGVPGSVVIDGETENALRDRILTDFKNGRIKCLINVGVLTTGFDYPALEAVLIARSTMSLALYYQIVGRVMRPHPDKQSAWVVDLGGNYNFFGPIETMQIKKCAHGHYSIWNKGRQLTNVPFTKN